MRKGGVKALTLKVDEANIDIRVRLDQAQESSHSQNFKIVLWNKLSSTKRRIGRRARAGKGGRRARKGRESKRKGKYEIDWRNKTQKRRKFTTKKILPDAVPLTTQETPPSLTHKFPFLEYDVIIHLLTSFQKKQKVNVAFPKRAHFSAISHPFHTRTL